MNNKMSNRFIKAWPIFIATLLIGILWGGALNPFIWEYGTRFWIGFILLIESVIIAVGKIE